MMPFTEIGQRPSDGLQRRVHDFFRHLEVQHCWFLMMGACVVVDAVFALAAGKFSESTLGYAAHFFSMTVGMDSWGPMLRALAHLHGPSSANVYGELFFTERVKFQYPLTSLLSLDLLARNPCNCVSPVRVMWFLSKFSVIGTGVVAVLLLYGAQQTRTTAQAWPHLTARPPRGILLLGGIAALFFYPLTRGDHLGQIQTLLTFVAALALLAQQRGRPVAAGLLIGICCTIKPQWAFAIFWALMTRQWRFAGAAAAVVACSSAVAMLLYGFQNFFDYLPVLKHVALRGESFYANQSINGLLNRLLSNGNNLEWLGNAFAPFHPAVYLATTLTSVALLAAVFFTAGTTVGRAEPLALVVATLTLASPIVWDHHYAVMLPILALVFPRWLTFSERRWGQVAVLMLSYLLIAVNLSPVVNASAASAMNFLQSYQLFGGVMLLTMLHRTCWLEREAAGRSWVRGRGVRAPSGRLPILPPENASC
ncbi:glycosyltransferase family 87 protein [Variovorax fucosicus]|uniref:glycosyltransferase family 87 protein n=1 Tax=Variovorax fucosicus TaxID=3053517 RepID=UPI002575C188|nr:glycosyltransferase family 87 protein [Variovorax sp. J22G47]MDM0059223.1 glycosyltransferase family 87 protein [Variovorax sp. J22G47]